MNNETIYSTILAVFTLLIWVVIIGIVWKVLKFLRWAIYTYLEDNHTKAESLKSIAESMKKETDK